MLIMQQDVHLQILLQELTDQMRILDSNLHLVILLHGQMAILQKILVVSLLDSIVLQLQIVMDVLQLHVIRLVFLQHLDVQIL